LSECPREFGKFAKLGSTTATVRTKRGRGRNSPPPIRLVMYHLAKPRSISQPYGRLTFVGHLKYVIAN